MIAFAHPFPDGPFLSKDEILAAKLQDKLALFESIKDRSGADVTHLSCSQPMHDMEVIGETENLFVLWTWRGPGDFDVRYSQRPVIDNAPPLETEETPDRETKAAAVETGKKTIAAIASGIKGVLGTIKKLFGGK